jgi:hypothetical protein
LDFALAALQEAELRLWAICGACCGAAILLRPDGALLLIAIMAYLASKAVSRKKTPAALSPKYFVKAALLVVLTAILPPVPWTLRNWRTFHRFQPLAPRYANEEDEFVPIGFNHWVKTWMADYTSVEEIYWQVPGSPINAQQLPSRAFDNPLQRDQTMQLISDYNDELHISPELDQRFTAIASERIRAHPLRCYLELPVLRILDMWLRPRTEMLPSDTRWWEFNDEPKWSILAISFGTLNLAYVLCAIAGWLRWRRLEWLGLLTLFAALRSAFLGTLENPEPRYTLEMYPIVIVLAAAALARTYGIKAETKL